MKSAALTPSLAAAVLATAGTALATDRPNIVLIMADDLGWRDTGFGGSDFYETPNMDQLAAEGMTFSAAYSPAANCAPSRAVLMSGQYTPRHGVYAVTSTKRGPAPHMKLKPIRNTPYLAGENVTVAEVLQAQGYATGIFGKWHLENYADSESGPDTQGFDTVMTVELTDSQIASDPKSVYAITDAASNFMRANRNGPFFAYLPHHAIHYKVQATQSSYNKFAAKPRGQRHNNVLYAASVYDFDDSVGQLLQVLDDLGLQSNTLVILTSDNGAAAESSQAPLRASKGCYYEGGIRVPMIVRWPGVIETGQTSEVLVSGVDLYPTILAAAGLSAPAGRDGENLMPVLQNAAPLSRESIFWHFPGYLGSPTRGGYDQFFRARPVSVMRKGDWKILLNHEQWVLDGGWAGRKTNGAIEVYNLSSDIGETKNLAGIEEATRDELLSELLAWIEDTDAPLPPPRGVTTFNDYNDDEISDVTAYDLSSGNWYIRKSFDDEYPLISFGKNWGAAGFVPVPGDYDGDWVCDLAAYNQESGNWFILSPISSVNDGLICFGQNWGGPGLVPVHGDYNGDGIWDLAVYESDTGNWFIRSLGPIGDNNPPICFGQNWGGPGLVPVPGDYNRDGVFDLAVYELATGDWFIRSLGQSGPNKLPIAFGRNWGSASCVPVPGDYNGDGLFDLAIREESAEAYYIASLAPGSSAISFARRIEQSDTDSCSLPVPGDYDGNGIFDLTWTRRPKSDADGQYGDRIWLWDRRPNWGIRGIDGWGVGDMIPVGAAWGGDEMTTCP